LTVAGAATSLTVGSLTGNLALPATVAVVTINGGAGNVEGATLTTTGAVTFNNTGTAAFTGNVSLGGNLTVGGNATIGGALAGPTSAGAITFNGETASVGSYAAKATASADTFAGTAALTITTLTDITSASKVTFNGPLTAVTNAVSVGTSGLTIAGTGVVRLEALPTITNALSIGNTAGVFIAGALVTGSTNTVTLTDAIFRAGDAASPISLTSASGSGIELGEGDALALNTGDTIVIVGTGAIALGSAAEISGAGTWTAASGEDEYLAIAVTAEGAFIGASLADGNTGAEAGTLTASTGTPAITVKASGTLAIGPKTTVALGGTSSKVGSIVLTHSDSNPGKLVFGGTGAQITTSNNSGSALSAAAGVFEAYNGTSSDKVPVSAFGTEDYVTITGGNDSLDSIVFGAGDAYITGPKNSGGSDATISAVTDCES
jgi:hypothetical protein